MSKRRHNFGTKRFKEKSLFIFHARIALKSLILLFVRLIARGARIGKTHRHTAEASEANFKWGGSVGMSITLLSCLLTRPRLIKLQNHFIGQTTNQNNVTKQNFYNIIINMTTKREITLDDQ